MAEDGTLVDVPDVVNNALLDIASKHGFKTPRFHVTSGSGNRDGFMSTLFRCVIRDEESAGPSDLCVMVKISREGMEAMMAHLFSVEALMYETLIPAVKELAQLRDPLPWPKCYFSNVKGAHPYCLAFEDFKPAGFVMADRTKPLDADHLRLALEQIGKHHGSAMALERLRPDLFKTLKDNLPDLTRNPEVFHVMKPFLQPVPTLPGLVKDRYPEGSEVRTVLKKLCDVFMTSFPQIMWPQPPKDGRGCTIIHGDCHVNNMAFKYDKNGKVEACKLYDLQAAAYRMVGQDLTALMFCNTEKATRDKHWDSLLRGYVETIHETLRTAGCKHPEEIFSWDILQEQLRRLAVPTLCMMPIFYGVMTVDDSVVDEIRSGIADRTKTDAGSAPSLLRPTASLVKEYEGLIEDLLSWGWFPSLEDIDRYAAED